MLKNALTFSLGRTPLHLSAQVGGSRNIRLLLDNGGNIATNDQDGESAIHKAVRGCHHKTLKVLYYAVLVDIMYNFFQILWIKSRYVSYLPGSIQI